MSERAKNRSRVSSLGVNNSIHRTGSVTYNDSSLILLPRRGTRDRSQEIEFCLRQSNTQLLTVGSQQREATTWVSEVTRRVKLSAKYSTRSESCFRDQSDISLSGKCLHSDVRRQTAAQHHTHSQVFRRFEQKRGKGAPTMQIKGWENKRVNNWCANIAAVWISMDPHSEQS